MDLKLAYDSITEVMIGLQIFTLFFIRSDENKLKFYWTLLVLGLICCGCGLLADKLIGLCWLLVSFLYYLNIRFVEKRMVTWKKKIDDEDGKMDINR